MILVLSTQLFRPRPLDAVSLAAVRSAGFEMLELVCDRAHFPYHDPAAVAEWKAKFEAAGLQIVSIQLPRGVPVFHTDAAERERAMEDIEAAIDAAELLGARIVVLSMGIAGEPATAHQQTYLEDAIARLSGYASPRGLELACENINSEITRVPRLAAAIENVGRSMVGVCVDVGTAHVEGDIAGSFRAAGRELYHLQFSDNDGSAPTQSAIGNGNIPWPAVLDTLREVQYSGLYVLEINDPSGGNSSVDALLAIAKESSARLSV